MAGLAGRPTRRLQPPDLSPMHFEPIAMLPLGQDHWEPTASPQVLVRLAVDICFPSFQHLPNRPRNCLDHGLAMSCAKKELDTDYPESNQCEDIN